MVIVAGPAGGPGGGGNGADGGVLASGATGAVASGGAVGGVAGGTGAVCESGGGGDAGIFCAMAGIAIMAAAAARNNFMRLSWFCTNNP
jgi:hypothetical protein